MKASIGIIGGTGLEEFDSGKVLDRVDIPTPFGMPSDYFTIVEHEGITAAILSRHGKGHRILPTEVNSKANIWALKSLGVKKIVAVSAVGSLAEEYKPGEFAVTSNLIDRTRERPSTYFGDGLAGHIGFAEPFCAETRKVIIDVLKKSGQSFHPVATIIAMEGPAFSTRAESAWYRDVGAHIIGMTVLPEAKLAREAEICYASIGMVTDYDCWRLHEEHVNIDMVLAVMNKNVSAIKNLVPKLIAGLAGIEKCACNTAAAGALMTSKEMVPYETRRKLDIFYGKYWK
ncbi:MAG: S-methyl-5'-thioadenosine phosphorylase [Spirochaetaceae bacterium]|nr:MAG: S-methyl-5'-thioadenosine phosphorylase [Spirochaetaceae bacterium]